MNRSVLVGVGIIIFIGFLGWLFIISTRPLPGTEVLQEGRNHLSEGSKIDYQFNPPTSGDHYPSWIAKGFYEEPRMDGNLIHSLEHGYIIIWYDCEIVNSSWLMVNSVYAQAQAMTQGSEGTPSAKLSDMPKAFSDGSCDQTKTQIKAVLQKYGPHKLIAMPRIGLDSPIVLTAWGKMEKLQFVDENRIKDFINSYRDNGPERTNEE